MTSQLATTPREIALGRITDQAAELQDATRALHLATGDALEGGPASAADMSAIRWLAGEVAKRAAALSAAATAVSMSAGPELATRSAAP